MYLCSWKSHYEMPFVTITYKSDHYDIDYTWILYFKIFIKYWFTIYELPADKIDILTKKLLHLKHWYYG